MWAAQAIVQACQSPAMMLPTTTSIGRQAESVAASFLVRRGYCILYRNWRCRYCEIDIVAKKNEVLSFVEVKYRRNNRQGSGIDYITSTKLRQMSFAARLWVNHYGWGGEYSLAAVEVCGSQFSVGQFEPDLS